MRLGAINLLENNYYSPSIIADKFVKGEIRRLEKAYVMEVITQEDIDAAQLRIDRREWKIKLRLESIEEELGLC